MGDYLTQTGAQRLANKITEVWREQGFDVNVRLERSGFDAKICLLYTSPSPRDRQKSRMPSSA